MIRMVSLIVMVTLIWGYTWVTMKIGLKDIPPFLFSALRMLIGAVPLFILQSLRRKPWVPAGKDWVPIGTMSLLMSLGYFGPLTYGMRFVSSGQTSVLVYSMPIIVTLLAHFFLNERLTLMKSIGLVFGVAGLLFILGPQVFHTGVSKVLLGQILIILSAVCWACANLFSKVRFANYDIIKMTSWQLLIGSAMLLCVSVAAEPWTGIHWGAASTASLLFNGIFSTAFTFVAWFWVLGQIEASTASMTLMAVPLLGLFFGWLAAR
ncbi:DMT family transporter [Paenibacillus sp. P25]|nr:DMT family transporter [Paenibacillus sp. P25]